MEITDKLFCIILVIAGVIVMNINKIFFNKNTFVLESSVWCLKGPGETNRWKFKNICYDPEFKTVLFFLNEKSIIKGVGHYEDLQKIQLSSVYSHNQFFANLSVIDAAKYHNKKQILQYQKAFMFSRFKPNNLMHIIHDDLFPLFLTLESICLGDVECRENYNLIMFDHYPKGPYFELYKLFSIHPPLVLSEFMLKTNLLCFNEVSVGLISDSIFFEYGFTNPQGPAKTNLLNQNDIYRFSKFIKSKTKIEEKETELLEVIIINRMKSRKILNINKVEELIKSAYKKLAVKIIMKTINLELSVNVIDLVKTISKADVMIGMHGAEMILSLFMKPNSVVFELFPFGIQPDVVSFIKPISELEYSELMYYSWRNPYRNHSVAYAEAHPLFGGIVHLDKSTQEKIKTTEEVPAVKCCNDPLYLHYMYQDTFVPNEFGDFFYKTVSKFHSQKKEIVSEKMIHKWFFPYKITNPGCRFHTESRQLNITWHPSFNADFNHLSYRLFVRGENGRFEKEFSTGGLSVRLEVPPDIFPKFQVWISVHYDINNSVSPDVYFECS